MFYMNTEPAKAVAGDMKTNAASLRAYAMEIRLIASSTTLWSGSYYATRGAIRSQATSVTNVAGYVQNLSGGLLQARTQYILTENELKGSGLPHLHHIGLMNDLFNHPWRQAHKERVEEILKKRTWSLPGAMAVCAATGAVSGEGSLFGLLYRGEASGNLLRMNADGEAYAEWDPRNKNARIGVKGSFDGALAEGEARGEYGLAKGEASGKVGHVTASGALGATLWDKDGRLNPSINAKLEGEATLLEGSVSGRIGTDDLNVNANAEGKVLTAQGEATANIGKMDDGSYGMEAKVGGDAYLAKGSVSGGLNIFGIKINATASGGVGGVEFNAGGKVSTNGVSGEFGLGLIAGGNIKLEVDWSDFNPPTLEDVGSAIQKTGEALYNVGKEAVKNVGETVSNVWNGVAGFFGFK